MDQFFPSPRLSLDSVRSSFLPSQSPNSSQSSFFAPSASFAPSSTPGIFRARSPDAMVFRDPSLQRQTVVPFDHHVKLLNHPLLSKEKPATRSVELAFTPDISRGIALLRSTSAQSVFTDFSLPPSVLSDVFVSPSPPSVVSSQSSHVQPHSAVLARSEYCSLKCLFSVRSLLRLLPLGSFDFSEEAAADSDESMHTSDDEVMTSFGKRKVTDTHVLDDEDYDLKRICTSAFAKISLKPEAQVVSATEQSVSQFLRSVSSTYANTYSHERSLESSKISLVEALCSVPFFTDESACAAIECELDGLPCETATTPELFASQLQLAYKECESSLDSDDEDDSEDVSMGGLGRVERAVVAVQEKLAMQTLDDLISCVDNLHEFLFGASITALGRFHRRINMYRLFTTVLFAMVCRSSTLVGLLERPKYRKQRNGVIAAFFRATLRPVQSESCADVVVLSKAGLAHLDAKQRKIPRDVVESVLRPALLQFCDLNKLNVRLVVGLHSIVELFPTLFKEVFAKKVLDTLSSFLEAGDSRVLHIPRSDVLQMLVYMLDFFRLFASTGAFSCVQWMDNLSQIVLGLEAKWSLSLTPRSSHQCRDCCHGFRSPLCRLLCQYPDQSLSLAMQNSDPAFANVFSSVMACRHAATIRIRLRSLLSCVCTDLCRQAIPRSDKFADVALIDASGRVIPAHRFVLASRSEYFQNLLGNGMLESGQSLIHIEDVDFRVLDILIDFLYTQSDSQLSGLSLEDLMALFTLGDRFLVPDIVELCEHALQSRVDRSTLLALIDFAFNELAGVKPLPYDSCGPAGMGVLRSCQAYLVSNLGSLAAELDVEDSKLLTLLATNHSALFGASDMLV